MIRDQLQQGKVGHLLQVLRLRGLQGNSSHHTDDLLPKPGRWIFGTGSISIQKVRFLHKHCGPGLGWAE